MYRSILVPLDGSPLSEQALPIAIDLCKRTAARLHLLHVRAIPGPAPAPDTELEYVNDVCARAATELDESVSFATLPQDVPRLLLPTPTAEVVAERINEYARSQQIELIVMATHGRGGVSRVWFGSITEVLLRIADIPLLLVRPQKADESASTPETLRNVLVPLDGTPEAETIFGAVRELPTHELRFHLLRVIPLPIAAFDPAGSMVFSPTTQQVERWREQAEADLNRTGAALAETHVAVKTSTVLANSPAAAILHYASENDIELIALTTHARRRLQRVVLGSVADKVIRGAECPVLVLRPQAATEAATQARRQDANYAFR